jgi:hypothetical protein
MRKTKPWREMKKGFHKVCVCKCVCVEKKESEREEKEIKKNDTHMYVKGTYFLLGGVSLTPTTAHTLCCTQTCSMVTLYVLQFILK